MTNDYYFDIIDMFHAIKKEIDYLTPPNFTDLSFNMITTHTQKFRKIKTTFFLDPVRQMGVP